MSLIKDIIVYAILGAIQGFSEPIPISSSGHLVLFQSIFEKLGFKRVGKVPVDGERLAYQKLKK